MLDHKVHQHLAVCQVRRSRNTSGEYHKVFVGSAFELYRIKKFIEIQLCHNVDLVCAPD